MDIVAGVAVAAVSNMTTGYHPMMKWLQWTPDRNRILGLVFTLLIIVCVFAVVVVYFPDIQQRRANAGFGPDWNCVAQPKGDPVCVKKPGR
jgi:predicted PurR-regulated permease PerM